MPWYFVFLMLLKKAMAILFLISGARVAHELGYRQVSRANLAVCAIACVYWCSAYHSRRRPIYLRGRRLGRATFRLRREIDGIDDTVRWGDEMLPADSATTHFLAVGTTGAGKTLLLNMLMRSVIPTIGKRGMCRTTFERRALVYDAKTDLLPVLYDMADCRIVTLHPFDARGAAWDIAKDITTPAAALQAAALLIPYERTGTSNPFFTLAAQNILRGVMISFLSTVGSCWTLRDVLLALRFEEQLRQVLEKSPEGRGIIDQYFASGETFQGVRATIATKMAPFEVVAASWDAAIEKVSASEFVNGEFVLVLGNDEAARTAIDAINRILFQRITELVLAGDENRTRQTWVFLDEVREAGKLEGLSRLMTKGRSKGACVALGFQAIEGMREAYGQNIADEIAGLCNNKALLRVESPITAQWASDLFGKVEEIDCRVSRTLTRSRRGLLATIGRNRTLSEQRITREAVLPSEIMTMPPTGPGNGLTGYFITRANGAYKATIPWSKLPVARKTRSTYVEAFIPRPERSQYLSEWVLDDIHRLGLKAVRLVTVDGQADNSMHWQKHKRSLRRVR